DEVIGELGRILKPGGIAGFAEPGARHSLSPMSQFEMRTYAVVENDIDVHAIWRTAKQAGFRDLKLTVFHGPPFYVSVAEYEDFLAGGQTTERWLTSTRVFLRDVRSFFLFKEGVRAADSRTVEGLACEIVVRPAAARAVAGIPVRVVVTIRNSGRATWLRADAGYGGVELGVHLYDSTGRMQSFDFHRDGLTDPPREIRPGETVEREIALAPLVAGDYQLEFDCVASGVTWFAQIGSRSAKWAVTIEP